MCLKTTALIYFPIMLDCPLELGAKALLSSSCFVRDFVTPNKGKWYGDVGAIAMITLTVLFLGHRN